MLTAGAVEGFVGEYLLPLYDRASPIRTFHRELWADCCAPDNYVADAAPRSHSKTTTVNLGYSLAAACLRFDPFQLKVSRTRDVAKEFLGTLKNQLATNERLIRDFGIKPAKDWTRDTEDDFICDFEDGYQIRMRAFGCEQPMRGINWNTIRPSLVICDDMEDDEQVLSAERREKVRNWFMGTLLPIGTAETKFRIVGTILHAESLLQGLIDSEGWRGRVYQACDDEVSEASILWPELWPRTRLMKLKQFYIEAGNLVKFNMEYRNIAVDTSSGYFQTTDFVPTDETDEHKAPRRRRYVGVDFAISTAERRDYTTMIVGGLDDEGFLVIEDVRRGRWDGKQIIDEMFSVEETWKPDQWFVEAGAIQKALGPALEIEMRSRGAQGTYMNLNPMVPTKDKASRARAIQSRMRSRAVRFDKRSRWFPDLEQELIQFPRGRHDDQVDAMAWLGLGLANMIVPLGEVEDSWERRRAQKREIEQQRVSFGLGGRSPVTGY